MISPLYASIYLYVGLYALQNGWLLLVTVTMAPHPTWSPAWFSLPGQCQAAKQPSSPAFLSLVGWFRYTIHIHIHIYIYVGLSIYVIMIHQNLWWFIRIYDDSFSFQHVAQKVDHNYDLWSVQDIQAKAKKPSSFISCFFFHWLFQNDPKKRWEVVLKILHRLSMLVTLVRSGSSSISPSRSFPTLAWSCCWLLLVMLMIPCGNMTIVFLCENSGNQWEITKFFDSCYHAISSIYIHMHIHSKLMQTVQLRRECWCLTSTPSQTLRPWQAGCRAHWAAWQNLHASVGKKHAIQPFPEICHNHQQIWRICQFLLWPLSTFVSKLAKCSVKKNAHKTQPYPAPISTKPRRWYSTRSRSFVARSCRRTSREVCPPSWLLV